MKLACFSVIDNDAMATPGASEAIHVEHLAAQSFQMLRATCKLQCDSPSSDIFRRNENIQEMRTLPTHLSKGQSE